MLCLRGLADAAAGLGEGAHLGARGLRLAGLATSAGGVLLIAQLMHAAIDLGIGDGALQTALPFILYILPQALDQGDRSESIRPCLLADRSGDKAVFFSQKLML